ncbi:hypothetical protein SNEBB_006298 [Seison nebaliae]|nr:hypothetical protein SNEBB_006298 [Seison nebaliae]
MFLFCFFNTLKHVTEISEYYYLLNKMNLDPKFPELLFQQKWNTLNNLFDQSDKSIRGILNNPSLGICLTNVIEEQKCNSIELCNYMEQMYQSVGEENPKDMKKYNKSVSDVFRTAVVALERNEEYNTKHGLVGDYYLVKASKHELDLQSEINESPNSKCERLILDIKEENGNDVVRWDKMLKDLFEIVDVQTVCQGHYVFLYYPDISVLNLHFSINKFPWIQWNQPRRFLRNYERIVGHHIIEDLTQNLIQPHAPDVLIMSLEESLKFELHPKATKTVAGILSLIHRLNVKWEDGSPDLPLVLVRQFYTIPQLKNDEDLRINLAIRNRRRNSYKLTGISVAIEEEHNLKISELLPVREVRDMYSQECVDVLYERTVEVILNEEPQIYDYLPQEQRYVRSIFKQICEWLDSDASNKLLDEAMETHAYAIIQRRRQWLLMNDEFSLKIDDIEQFTYILRFEKVTGFILEKEKSFHEEKISSCR